MANAKIIHMTGVGTVSFEKSRRAKYINISVRPLKGVRVAVPVGVSMSIAKEIAQSKAKWIKAQIHKMEQIEKNYYSFAKDQQPIDIADAKKKIVSRLNELSKKYHIPFNSVSIRNPKNRWGSCSAKKKINLNIKIINLPGELMDYVILHELVHIKHRNHGRKYWHELDKIVGSARSLDKQLDNYEPLLIWPLAGVN